MKIVSWNIAHRSGIWRDVLALDADVALLQEACEPPADIADLVAIESDPWRTDGRADRRWRTSVVGLRKGLEITRIQPRALSEAGPDDLAVSRAGTVSAARVISPITGETITLVSMYSLGNRPEAQRWEAGSLLTRQLTD